MRRLAMPFVLAIMLLSPCAARAGASLLVDDAGTVPDGRCQLESWLRLRLRSGGEATAAPACSLGGMEYSLGGSANAGTPAGPWLSAGLKRTLHDIDETTPGVAVSLAGNWRRFDHRLATGTANVAVSLPLDPAWAVHVNLGWNTTRGASPQPSGGVGMQYALGAHWSGLAELYAVRGAGGALQAGLRRSFGHGLSVDLLAGHDRDGRWLTFGFNYAPGNS